MELTFEQLPRAVATIMESLQRIENLLQQKNEPLVESDRLLTVTETAEFLKLAVPTIYGLIHNMAIPYSKKGKRVYFTKSELLEWIRTGRRKTMSEIQAEADSHLLRSRNMRRK